MTHTETHDTAAQAAGAPMAPAPAAAQNGAKQKKGAPQGRKTAAAGKAKAAPKRKAKGKAGKGARAQQAAAPRAEGKGAQILALIGRPQGATLAELRKTTGWQAHSVRGFLSTAAKKQSLQIESTKSASGDRVYRSEK